MITVTNLMTAASQTYSCSPREAVIAAYAQAQGDWNTWDYEKKYGAMVQYNANTGRQYVTCGDQTARVYDLIDEANRQLEANGPWWGYRSSDKEP